MNNGAGGMVFHTYQCCGAALRVTAGSVGSSGPPSLKRVCSSGGSRLQVLVVSGLYLSSARRRTHLGWEDVSPHWTSQDVLSACCLGAAADALPPLHVRQGLVRPPWLEKAVCAGGPAGAWRRGLRGGRCYGTPSDAPTPESYAMVRWTGHSPACVGGAVTFTDMLSLQSVI